MTVRIVIVEDDMDDIILLNEIFASTPFASSVQFFCNPEGVIPYFDKMPASELPSIIISDLNMPKLNGFELLKALKASERYRHIPVLICTTSTSEREKAKALTLGAEDYITKPVKTSGYYQVIEKIKTLLNE